MIDTMPTRFTAKEYVGLVAENTWPTTEGGNYD